MAADDCLSDLELHQLLDPATPELAFARQESHLALRRLS